MSLLDDPKKAPNLESYEGLGLVDFVVLPHYGDKKYEKKYQRIMGKFGKKRLKLIPLTNEQAIIMKGRSYRITG
jgi:dipeptidase E